MRQPEQAFQKSAITTPLISLQGCREVREACSLSEQKRLKTLFNFGYWLLYQVLHPPAGTCDVRLYNVL